MPGILNIIAENNATNSNASISEDKNVSERFYSISGIYIKFRTV